MHLATNNEAEYRALLLGLMSAEQVNRAVGIRRLVVQGDSLLVVQQIRGSWQINKPKLKKAHSKAMELLHRVAAEGWRIEHIPREENKRADQLANRGMDTRTPTPLVAAPWRARFTSNACSVPRSNAPAGKGESSDNGAAAPRDGAAQPTKPKVGMAALTRTMVNRMRVSELRDALEERGLSTEGIAGQLRDRLKLALGGSRQRIK